MNTENPSNEEQLNKSEAKNEAARLQDYLYGWSSPHLRSHKGFPAEQYREFAAAREKILELRPILEQLPKSQPARQAELTRLIYKYPPSILVSAWSENIADKCPKSRGYQKFSDYSSPLFEDVEKNFFLTAGQQETGTAKYNAPSNYIMPLASELYDRTSGKAFLSPQELKYNLEQGVRGKNILEIAPGPGWFMKVLKDCGANVKGLDKDISHEYIARAWNLDIKQGDANHLASVFEEQFDIIISNNFITSSLVTELDAKNILRQCLQKLKSGGISVHSTQYFKIPYEFWILTRLIHDPSEIRELGPLLENPPAEETIIAFDFPVLTDADIKSLGVTDFHSANENGYHVFSFKKPAG